MEVENCIEHPLCGNISKILYFASYLVSVANRDNSQEGREYEPPCISGTTVLGEIPTGYIGNRVGRRNSLVFGTALIAATLVGISFAGSFLTLAML